jgi:hypothetical protein
MRPHGFTVLAITATVLLGTLAIEIGHGIPDGTAELAAPSDAPSAAQPTQAPAADRTDAWVATILARPLFSADRRPPIDEATTDAAVVPDASPRLAGVLVSPAGKTAIFADPTGGKPIVVREGGRIGAYTVRAIEAGQVTLTGPQGVQVLRPAFAPGSAGPGSPAAAAPPPAGPVQAAIAPPP